jgi:S1-C subfamily serine protease
MNPTMSDPTETSAPADDDVQDTRPGIVSSREFEPVGGDEPSAVPAAPAVPTSASPARPRRSASRTLGTGLLVVLLGFGGGVGGWWVGDNVLGDDPSSTASKGATFQPTNDSASSAASRTDPDDDSAGRTPQQIYAAMSPAVAHIDSRIVKTTTDFFGQQSEQEGEGTGSGFIIDTKGHIVTNAHVIEDAKSITVSLGKDNVTVPAKVVGQDPSSDVAVLEFDPDAKALDGVELAVATFGDSSKLSVGDPVAAIGNPFGLDRTLTTGVVSALQRNIPALNDFSISDVIQTDAAVNPGNSGGPLFNADGQVIGVNSQISTRGGGFDGIAFAVPSNTVEKVAKQLVKSGSIDYAWLGVQGGELTSDLADQLDVDLDHGVYVGEVTSGGPADKAGLEGGRQLRDVSTGQTVVQGGDILLSFDGEKLTSMSQLSGLVAAKDPGDEVEVEYVRDGKHRKAKITLGERPATSSDDDSGSDG